MSVYYINKKNKKIDIEITTHAQLRFIERYNKLFFKIKANNKNWEELFNKYFLRSNRVKNLNRKEKQRFKKRKEETLLFRGIGLTFVVSNAKVITVEISDKDKRHLN